MSYEVRIFTVTIPKGTTKAAIFKQQLTMPPRLVREIEITVPPGPRGEVGFQIGSSGFPVIPTQSDQYIITDNEVIRWKVENQIDSGAWEFFGYNTGSYNHTLYVRFLVDPVADPPQYSQVTPITFYS